MTGSPTTGRSRSGKQPSSNGSWRQASTVTFGPALGETNLAPATIVQRYKFVAAWQICWRSAALIHETRNSCTRNVAFKEPPGMPPQVRTQIERVDVDS